MSDWFDELKVCFFLDKHSIGPRDVRRLIREVDKLRQRMSITKTFLGLIDEFEREEKEKQTV